MNFSEKLIRLRKREGISQEELASYLEVSRQAVSRWEQGTALPDAGNLLKLRQRFGVSLDWLLDDSQGWENLTDGAPTGSEGGGTAPSPKLRKSVLPWAIPLGVSGFGLLLLGIFSSVFPAEYMVASTVIAGKSGAGGPDLSRPGRLFEVQQLGVAVPAVFGHRHRFAVGGPVAKGRDEAV